MTGCGRHGRAIRTLAAGIVPSHWRTQPAAVRRFVMRRMPRLAIIPAAVVLAATAAAPAAAVDPPPPASIQCRSSTSSATRTPDTPGVRVGVWCNHLGRRAAVLRLRALLACRPILVGADRAPGRLGVRRRRLLGRGHGPRRFWTTGSIRPGQLHRPRGGTVRRFDPGTSAFTTGASRGRTTSDVARPRGRSASIASTSIATAGSPRKARCSAQASPSSTATKASASRRTSASTGRRRNTSAARPRSTGATGRTSRTPATTPTSPTHRSHGGRCTPASTRP